MSIPDCVGGGDLVEWYPECVLDPEEVKHDLIVSVMQLDHDFKPELDHGHLGDQFACLIGILVMLGSGVNHDQEWWPGQSLWHSTSDVKFRNPRTLNVSSKLQSCSSPRSPWLGWPRVPPGWHWCGSGSWSSLWLKCKKKLLRTEKIQPYLLMWYLHKSKESIKKLRYCWILNIVYYFGGLNYFLVFLPLDGTWELSKK